MKPKQKEFVAEYIQNGNNATQAVKDVYDIEDENYAGVKGHRLIRSDKIQNAILSIAEQIPDDLLVQVHLEGLNASRTIKTEDDEIVEPDYAVRHKYLDTAHKLKGTYAPDRSLNLNVNLDNGLTDEEKEGLRKLLKQ
jgi:hypothetical protein